MDNLELINQSFSKRVKKLEILKNKSSFREAAKPRKTSNSGISQNLSKPYILRLNFEFMRYENLTKPNILRVNAPRILTIDNIFAYMRDEKPMKTYHFGIENLTKPDISAINSGELLRNVEIFAYEKESFSKQVATSCN